jgi:glycerate kinase
MHKIILIPDSFKGTMESAEICRLMAKAVESHYPTAKILSFPVADGGEGTVDAILSAAGGKKVFVGVKGPYFGRRKAFFGITESGDAVIETASCAGLTLVEHNLHPDLTTTYGVGQLIARAAAQGCSRIIVGLGGSCTNDGGAGAAAACGVKFYDKNRKTFIPTGGTLADIAAIDDSEMNPAVRRAQIIAMCDVDSPLYGPSGAAYVFAPQKGADAAMVQRLDEGLKHYSDILRQCLGIDISTLPGAGAAGGLGGGMAAFFHAELRSGIETILDLVHFDEQLQGADLVLTGEGKIDAQSLRGKVVSGVARHAKKQGVPVVAVVGDIDGDMALLYELGVAAVFSINRRAEALQTSRRHSREDLSLTVDNLMHFLKRLGF